MAYTNVYPQRINWENEPSIASPINETNLNKMDYALYQHDQTFAAWDTTKANQSDLLLSVKSIDYDTETGVFVFTWQNGTTKTVDLNIEKIPVSFSMDANGVITMTTDDGTTYTADVGALIKTYTFTDSSVIDFTVTTDASGNKTITAGIVDGSITGNKLQPNYLADCQAAQTGAETAQGLSEDSAEDAEAWAIGTRNGTPVPSTDPAYNNNSKYWAEHTSSSLYGLTDTDIDDPQDGQVPTYNSSTGKWENADQQGGSASIDDTTIAVDKVWSSYKTNNEVTDRDKTFKDHSNLQAWNALSLAEKIKNDFVAIDDDYDPSNISNPNLLDNPWFTVNQRGFSSDNTLGYTVDRWKNNIGNFTVAISDDIITLTKSSDTTISEFVQYFELSRLSACVGKYITLSVMLSDGTIYKGSGIMPTLTSSLQWFINFSIGDNFTAGCGVRTTSNCLVRIKSNIESATLSVKAVKLELGSVSTLAMDTAPNYATELLKCQRYFQKFAWIAGAANSLGSGFANVRSADNKYYLSLAVKLNCPMRTTPVLSVIGDISACKIIGNQSIYSVSEIVRGLSNSVADPKFEFPLQIISSNSLPTQTVCAFLTNKATTDEFGFILSADL